MGTEIYDCNGVPLEITDKVKLFNGDGNILLVGNVECCFGALGITTNDTINWDAIYDMAKRKVRLLVSYIMITSFRFGKLRGILIIRATTILQTLKKSLTKFLKCDTIKVSK